MSRQQRSIHSPAERLQPRAAASRRARLRLPSLRDDEPKVRSLLRLLTAVLGLALAVAGAGGLWLSQGGDDRVRGVEQQLVKLAEGRAPANDAKQRAAYTTQARDLAALGKRLTEPPAYGGLLGAGATLLSLALFALGSKSAKSVKPTKSRPAGRERSKGGGSEPARAATVKVEEEEVEHSSKDRKRLL